MAKLVSIPRPDGDNHGGLIIELTRGDRDLLAEALNELCYKIQDRMRKNESDERTPGLEWVNDILDPDGSGREAEHRILVWKAEQTEALLGLVQ